VPHQKHFTPSRSTQWCYVEEEEEEEEEEEGGLNCRSATRPHNNTTRFRTKGRREQNTPLEQSSANILRITQAGNQETRATNTKRTGVRALLEGARGG
jgi:hypothetical protein